MDEQIKAAKTAIRQQIKARRATQDARQKALWDRRIVASMLAHPRYIAATTVMPYMATAQEINLDALVAIALSDGKAVCLPRVEHATRQMWAHRFQTGDALVTGALGIREPLSAAPVCAAAEIDLVVMPGLAFSLRGERIGYGGGYYDRFLAACDERVFLLAVGYDWQVFSELPSAPEDRRINAIVTPTRVVAT